MLPPPAFVRQPHGRVAYRATGAGPAILFMHGLGGHSASWAAQLGSLSANRRVIAWDCPGYGESDPFPEEAPDVERYAAAAIALIDALGIDRLALVGHSMGGVLAPRIAARLAERVTRLVLSCTRASFVDRDPSGIEQRLAERASLDDAAFGRRRAESMAAPGADPAVVARLARIAGSARNPGYAQAARMLSDTDNTGVLRGLTVPTLVIVGAEDRIAPPALGDRIAELLPDARLAKIAAAGHAPYAEQSAAYDAALREFLGV